MACDEDDVCTCTPEQAVKGLTEEAIIRFQETVICLGRIHRLCLKEEVNPFDIQIQYLSKALSDADDLIHVLSTICTVSSPHGA